MTTTSAVVSLLAPLVILQLGSSVAYAQVNDMFPTKAAAEQRAKQLKCSGAFAMGNDWMPCANERAFHAALQTET